MGSPPASTTPPPPPSLPRPPPTSDASILTSAVKRTHKASRLRSLSTRPLGVERPVVHVDPATGKADGPHKKKLRTYLGIVARDKVDITYENWKEVPTAQKDLIWKDIQASDSRTKRKLLQTVGRDGGSLNQTSRGNGPLQPIRTVLRTLFVTNTTSARKSGPNFARLAETLLGRMCASRHKPSRSRILPPTFCLVGKLLAEKTKKKMQEAAQSGSVDGVIDPPSPVRCHVKWKMARTKKIVSHFQLTITIMFEYFENVMIRLRSRPHRDRSSPMDVRMFWPLLLDVQSTLDVSVLLEPIRDQLEESITEKVTRQVMASFSQLQSQMQSQGPPEPLVGPGPSSPRVSTKGSCVDPSGNDPKTGDSDRCGLYIEADPARLVAMGRVYEGSTLVHDTPLLPGQVKVSVDEVKDAHAAVPVPTAEVSLVGQALHTFLAWPTHLIKSLSNQVAVSPPKPPLKPDPEVDDPLYLMTLTIPELFLRPYQVRWDATVFGVVNPDFPLYIKHEDLSEIAHGGQCLSISVLQLWILHLTETCMRAGNSNIYGFLEPQSIQRFHYSGHWQMVVILPKEHLVVWFCSLHNRPDNYLKGIINSAIKGLDDAPQPKSKAPARWIVVKCNRQKGTTECGYYVMHWMSTIILGSFRNNWEAYFNDPRPLEPERLKALWIQWAQFYLRVRDQA
ncbi:hypothetical protein HKD37_11G032014 [Glycine soja]